MKPEIKGAPKAKDLTVAEIMKLGETDPEAADAALQRMSRAREAEAPSDIENVDNLLGDLELGAGEALEVVEHLDELDAAAEDAIEGAIAKAEAYEAQDVLDEARKEQLREQMRAKLAEINGGDPLAKDKKKISNALKKVGRTPADLPPDFWDLPRIAKIPCERSRQSEFYRVCEEGQEEMREAERLRELEKHGRPANYDRLPWDERHRIDANIRQRQHRDKTRKPPSKPTVAPLPVAYVAPDMLSITLQKMSRSLDTWTRAGSTPLARQLRKPEHRSALIRAAAAYARYFNTPHQKPPSRAELAKKLRCSEGQARRKLDVLKSLYSPGGPWAGA